MNDAWSYVGDYIHGMSDERRALREELADQKSENNRLREQLTDLRIQLQAAENRGDEFRTTPSRSEHSRPNYTPTDVVTT